jgi:integral membrane protein
MFSTPAALFRVFAVAEMVTWALLLSAILIRAMVGLDSSVFFVVGASHGFTFLGYAVTAKIVGLNQRWSFGRIALAVMLAIVPFATVPFDRSLERKGLLEGPWRREESDDPRDKVWYDRVLRWYLARPIVLALAILIFIVALFTILLLIGPPYQGLK